MAYALKLPKKFKDQKWKVKIRDRERAEPPHVSVLYKNRTWRIGLRERAFLDKEPPPGDVPEELIEFVLDQIDELVREWDKRYPENPVESE